MKIALIARKPRNPLALLGRSRRAGAHGASPKAQRQADRVALKREMGNALDHRRSP